MTKEVRYEIQCPCGEFFVGRNHGAKGEKRAVRQAIYNFLTHAPTTKDMEILDVSTEDGLTQSLDLLQQSFPEVHIKRDKICKSNHG